MLNQHVKLINIKMVYFKICQFKKEIYDEHAECTYENYCPRKYKIAEETFCNAIRDVSKLEGKSV